MSVTISHACLTANPIQVEYKYFKSSTNFDHNNLNLNTAAAWLGRGRKYLSGSSKAPAEILTSFLDPARGITTADQISTYLIVSTCHVYDLKILF